MSDFYTEQLVKKQSGAKEMAIRAGLIVLTVIAVFIVLMFPLGIILPILAVVLDVFMFRRLNVEYEYLFVNGEFDIDMVMAKSKRKRVKSFNLSEADLVAPLNSHRMDYYNGNQNMKVLDYSSGNPQHKRFGVITRLDNATCKIILEPDEALAQAMKKTAPSKVFLD